MAERKAFQVSRGEISAPPRSGAPDALGQGLEEFGTRLQGLSQRLIGHWVAGRVQEESAKGAKAGASGNFTPVRSGTEAGNAYDNAGLESYFEKLKIQTSDDVERIYSENKDDPAKLENAVAAYGEGVGANIAETMPELVPHFQSFFDRTSRPFRRQAAEDYDRNQRAQRTADVSSFLSNKQLQDERRAFIADGSDQSTADITLGRQDYIDALAKLGPQGGFELGGKKYEPDPSRAGSLDQVKLTNAIDSYDQMIVGARIKGEFKRAQKAGSGERFVQNFAKPGASDTSLQQRDSLINWMRGEITDARALTEATDKTTRAAVGAASDALWRGETPGGLAELQSKVRGTDLQAELDAAVASHDTMAQVAKMPPQQAQAAIDDERAALGRIPASDPNYAVAVHAGTLRLAKMEQLRDENARAIKEDSFAWAVNAGIVKPAPLLTQDGMLDPASMNDRIDASETISHLTGVPTAPITKGEGAALVAGLMSGGLVQSAQGFANSDAPTQNALKKALRAIEPNYPEVAQVATFAMNGRASPVDKRNVAQLLDRGYSLMTHQEGKPPLFALKPGNDGKLGLEGAFDEFVGDAFVGNAAARQRALSGVTAAYAAYAEGRPGGLTGGFDDGTFRLASQAYFGTTEKRAMKIRGGSVFAPYGMTEAEFTVGLYADAAAKLKGVYSPEQVRSIIDNAKPQNTADGYILRAGDSYVSSPDGRPIVFNPIKVPAGSTPQQSTGFSAAAFQ